MGPAEVKLDELMEALEFVSAAPNGEHQVFLDRQTGALHFRSDGIELPEDFPDDIEDGSRYIAVPSKHDLHLGRRVAISFVEVMLPDQLDEAHEIFRRRGAYARFKSMLERRRALQRWYEYEAEAKREALREWCDDNSFCVQD